MKARPSFFEKKEAKKLFSSRSISICHWPRNEKQRTNKSFLVLFFKKGLLAFAAQINLKRSCSKHKGPKEHKKATKFGKRKLLFFVDFVLFVLESFHPSSESWKCSAAEMRAVCGQISQSLFKPNFQSLP